VECYGGEGKGGGERGGERRWGKIFGGEFISLWFRSEEDDENEVEATRRELTFSLLSVAPHPQLQEFGSKYESETLRSSKKLDLADVIVYVFDSSDTNSFSYISNLRVS